MNPSFKKPLPLLALVTGLGLMLAGRMTAQTFTTVHAFTATSGPLYTNSDGANPAGGLILTNNILYGTARYGGSSGCGTLFKVNTDGTGFTTLHSFSFYGSDGNNPDAGLILSSNTLYGTAYASVGGTGAGTVFKVNTDGTSFSTLHSFTGGGDGNHPQAGLLLSGKTLYGTTYGGGNNSSPSGTVFAVNTDGTGFTTLYSFTGGKDGGGPSAGLMLLDKTLYGTASDGGNSGDHGTVFAVNTDGTGFTILHSFSYFDTDGNQPQAGLLLSGNILYGTAAYGGISSVDGGSGTVFAVNTDGTGFTTVYRFTGGIEGANPYAGLILYGDTLFGTTSDVADFNLGTVFAVNTDGTGFTSLHSFDINLSDGANPYAGLILSANTLYGTASLGGSSGNGTVFSLSLPAPQLTIMREAASVILTWPTNASGFHLQSTASLVSSALWNNVSPGPIVVNGQNAVTNPVSGAQMFYRLSQF